MLGPIRNKWPSGGAPRLHAHDPQQGSETRWKLALHHARPRRRRLPQRHEISRGRKVLSTGLRPRRLLTTSPRAVPSDGSFSETKGKTKMDMTMTLPTPEAAEETRKIHQEGAAATRLGTVWPNISKKNPPAKSNLSSIEPLMRRWNSCSRCGPTQNTSPNGLPPRDSK